jgi:hypothetical protein
MTDCSVPTNDTDRQRYGRVTETNDMHVYDHVSSATDGSSSTSIRSFDTSPASPSSFSTSFFSPLDELLPLRRRVSPSPVVASLVVVGFIAAVGVLGTAEGPDARRDLGDALKYEHRGHIHSATMSVIASRIAGITHSCSPIPSCRLRVRYDGNSHRKPARISFEMLGLCRVSACSVRVTSNLQGSSPSNLSAT